MKTATVIDMNAKHPIVDKAIKTLDAMNLNLRGGYYDEKLAEILAIQEYGSATEFTLYCAEVMIEAFHNDIEL